MKLEMEMGGTNLLFRNKLLNLQLFLWNEDIKRNQVIPKSHEQDGVPRMQSLLEGKGGEEEEWSCKLD